MGDPVASGTLAGSTSGSWDSSSRATRSSWHATRVRSLRGSRNIDSPPWAGAVCLQVAADRAAAPRRLPQPRHSRPARRSHQAAARSTTLRCPSLATCRSIGLVGRVTRFHDVARLSARAEWLLAASIHRALSVGRSRAMRLRARNPKRVGPRSSSSPACATSVSWTTPAVPQCARETSPRVVASGCARLLKAGRGGFERPQPVVHPSMPTRPGVRRLSVRAVGGYPNWQGRRRPRHWAGEAEGVDRR